MQASVMDPGFTKVQIVAMKTQCKRFYKGGFDVTKPKIMTTKYTWWAVLTNQERRAIKKGVRAERPELAYSEDEPMEDDL